MSVCLLDGNELVHVDAPPVAPVVQPESAPSQRGFILLGLGGVLLGLGAVALAGITVLGQSTPPPAPTVAPAPPPEPVAKPEPPPPPEPPKPMLLTSQPSGASVFDGDSLLCVTPCELEPVEGTARSFRLELDGFESVAYDVDSQVGRHQVALKEKSRRSGRSGSPSPSPVAPSPPSPSAPSPTAPSPAPDPQPVAPDPEPAAPDPVAPTPEPGIAPMSDFKDPFE